MSQAPLFAREMGLFARFGVYALLSLSLIVLDARYASLGWLRTGLSVVLDPLQGLVAAPLGWTHSVSQFMVAHNDLIRTNTRLVRERDALGVQQQDRQTLQAENDRLRALLQLPPSPRITMLAAEIVRAMPDPFSRKIIISRGATQGIEAGLPVIDASGLVGQVTQVSAMTAEVTLLTDRDQGAPVQDQRNGVRVIVSGTGSDNLLEVRFLDVHADLKAGDLLYTSGLDGLWPAGIPVAQVLQTEPPKHTPFARALCRPLGQVGQYRHVMVLKPHAKGAR